MVNILEYQHQQPKTASDIDRNPPITAHRLNFLYPLMQLCKSNEYVVSQFLSEADSCCMLDLLKLV